MTRAEIRNSIKAALNPARPGVTSQTVRWTDFEINSHIDDGYIDLAEKTGAVVETVQLSAPGGQHFLDLPDQCLFPIAATDVASGLPIDFCHWSLIDGHDTTWIRRQSSRPELMAAWGLYSVLLYPAYQAAGTIELTMAVVPSGLASDGSEPDLPDEYHQALVHWGHAQCLLKGADERRFGRALRQLGYYGDVAVGLGSWAGERHQGILQAIYGEALRVPSPILEGS